MVERKSERGDQIHLGRRTPIRGGPKRRRIQTKKAAKAHSVTGWKRGEKNSVRQRNRKKNSRQKNRVCKFNIAVIGEGGEAAEGRNPPKGQKKGIK